MYRLALFMALGLVLCTFAQPTIDEDCDDDDGVRRLQFAEERGMIDPPPDVMGHFVLPPADYTVGRPKPMLMSPEDPVSAGPDGLTVGRPKPMPVSPEDPVSAGPDGLRLAERVHNSAIVKGIKNQKEEELADAVDRAMELALAVIPSPAPNPVVITNEDEVEVQELELFPSPGAPADSGPGVGVPELPQPEIKRVTPPTAPYSYPSTNPSVTPSASPSPSNQWEMSIEHELEDCDDAPTLMGYTPITDDTPSGSYSIDALRGQTAPSPTKRVANVVTEPTEFEELPNTPQEHLVEEKDLYSIAPAVRDNGMEDATKYQVYALHEMYSPVPNTRKSLRQINLAGDDMGQYNPSLGKMDEIKRSTSLLAGEILGTQSPLKLSAFEEEFRANELAYNVSWSLMNDPQFETPVARPASEEPIPETRPPAVSIPVARLNHTTHRNVSEQRPPSPQPTSETEAVPAVSGPGDQRSEEAEVMATDLHLGDETGSGDHITEEIESSVDPSEVEAGSWARMPERQEQHADGEEIASTPVPKDNRDVYLGGTDVVRIAGITSGGARELAILQAPGPGDGRAMPGMSEQRLGAEAHQQPCNDDLATAHEAVREEEEEAQMLPSKPCQATTTCEECVYDSTCVWCPSMDACRSGSEAGPESELLCATDYLYDTCTWASQSRTKMTSASEKLVQQVIPSRKT